MDEQLTFRFDEIGARTVSDGIGGIADASENAADSVDNLQGSLEKFRRTPFDKAIRDITAAMSPAIKMLDNYRHKTILLTIAEEKGLVSARQHAALRRRLTREIAASVDPIVRAQQAQSQAFERVAAAQQIGAITAERAAELNKRVSAQYEAQINPLQALNRELDRKTTILSATTAQEQIAASATDQLVAAEQRLLAAGVVLTSQQRHELGQRYANVASLEAEKRARDRARVSMESFAKEAILLRTAFFSLGGTFLIGELIRMADVLQNLENRFTFVAGSIEGAKETTQALAQISQETRSSFEQTGVVYTRTAFAAKNLGLEQAQLIQFTKSLNQAVILSGVSSEEARAGLQQLSQAIASNRLAGDELRSVLEQLPAVAEIIASEFGVSAAELKGLIKADQDFNVGARDIINGILRNAERLEEQFKSTKLTIGQSLENLRTRTTLLLGEFNDLTGSTTKVAESIDSFSRNLRVWGIGLLTIAGILAIVNAESIKMAIATKFNAFVTLLATADDKLRTLSLASLFGATKAATTGTYQLAGGTVVYTGAAQVATGATLSFAGAIALVEALSGPLGWLLLAAGAIIAYTYNLNQAKQTTENAILEFKELTAELGEQSKALEDLFDEIDPLGKKQRELVAAQQLLDQSYRDGALSAYEFAQAQRRVRTELDPLVDDLDRAKIAAEGFRAAQEEISRLGGEEQFLKQFLATSITEAIQGDATAEDIRTVTETVNGLLQEVGSAANVAEDDLGKFRSQLEGVAQDIIDKADESKIALETLGTQIVALQAVGRGDLIGFAAADYAGTVSGIGDIDEAIQSLRDQIDPAAARQRAYNVALVSFRTALALAGTAVEDIDAKMDEFKKKLDEWLKLSEEAANQKGPKKAANNFEREFEKLRDSLDTVGAATREYEKDKNLLRQALNKGKIDVREYGAALATLDLQTRDALDPVGALTRSFEEEFEKITATTAAEKAAIEARTEMNALLESGIPITQDMIATRIAEKQAIADATEAWKEYNDQVKLAQKIQDDFAAGGSALNEFLKKIDALSTLEDTDEQRRLRGNLIEDLKGSLDSLTKLRVERDRALSDFDSIQETLSLFGEGFTPEEVERITNAIKQKFPTASETVQDFVQDLRSQIEALNETDPVMSRVNKIVKDFADKEIELDAATIQTITDLERQREVLTQQEASLKRVTQQLGINQEQLQSNALDLDTLNRLYADGEINLRQYTQALLGFELAALKTDTTLEGGLRRGILQVQLDLADLSKTAEQTVTGAFQKAEDAIVKMVETGKFSFRDLVTSILSDLARLATQQIFNDLLTLALGGLGGAAGGLGGGGGGGVTGGFGDIGGNPLGIGRGLAADIPQGAIPGTLIPGTEEAIMSNQLLAVLVAQTEEIEPLLQAISNRGKKQYRLGLATGIAGLLGGFATGGTFTVPGSGAPDSRVVAFRVTPGEQVDVRTPAQQRNQGKGEAGAPHIEVHYHGQNQPRIEAEYDRFTEKTVLRIIENNPERVNAATRR